MTNHTQTETNSPACNCGHCVQTGDTLQKVTPTEPVGVCALLFNQNGQILVGKRKNSYGAGKDGFPGGRLELHEPLRVGITREIKEETGLLVTDLKFLGVVREAQTNCDFIHFVYVATHITQSPQLCEPEKCEGWRWGNVETIKNNLLPGHLKALQLYQSGIVLIDDFENIE